MILKFMPLLALCSCIQEDIHDFVTDRGMAVFLNDYPTTKEEIELCSDIAIGAAVYFPFYSKGCVVDGFNEVELRFTERFSKYSNGQFSTDNGFIKVRPISPCVAETALIHELGHMFQWYCEGIVDYHHQEELFWSKNIVSNLSAQQEICPPLTQSPI